MPLLNFQKQFADDVECGKKNQTIRKTRKRPIKAGDNLYLYTGLRTKKARELKETICKTVEDIIITEDKDIIISGEPLNGGFDHFAQLDGFKDYNDMLSWFNNTHGLPFTGQLIRW